MTPSGPAPRLLQGGGRSLGDVVTTTARSAPGPAAALPWERPAPAGAQSHVRAAVRRFVVVGVISFALVSVPTVLGMLAIARNNALEVAKEQGIRLASSTIAPLVTQGVVDGDPAAVHRLDQVVDARMSDGSVVRVKVWDVDGRVLYSDVPELIGKQYPLQDWMVDLLRDGGATADIETLDDEENEAAPRHDSLVEVYALGTAATGHKLVFEAYFPLDPVQEQERTLLVQMLPLGVAALLLLLLVQLPSALRLARTVERGDAAKGRLLRQAVAASDLERRRIARDLHDDVIQDLAGVAYALESAEPRLDGDARPLVARARDIVRRDVASLREMLAELYPADLDSLGLPSAIDELAEPLRRAGVEVAVDVPDVRVDRTSATLLYRVARESLTNVAKHAGARRVEVRLVDRPSDLVLTVLDDGRGFDASGDSARGHLGLRLVRDTVAEAGGSVEVTSTEGVGTCIAVHLPRT
jgi:signal transduction histidine kinase